MFMGEAKYVAGRTPPGGREAGKEGRFGAAAIDAGILKRSPGIF
jgi:hypothetical protein